MAEQSLLERGGRHDETAHNTIKAAVAEKYEIDAMLVGKYMLGPRNFLKHANDDHFNAGGEDVQTRAINQILQALINLVRLDSCVCSECPRFLDWLNLRRPDLRS